MKQKMGKTLASFLALALVLGLALPGTVFAATTYEPIDEASLRNAVANAATDDTIVLDGDITLTGTPLEIPVGFPGDVVLDGGGHTLTGAAGQNVITVAADATVTIANLTITHTGGEAGRGITVNSGATLTLGSDAVVTGNTTVGGANSKGGGVQVNGGTLVMNAGSKVTDNTATGIDAFGGGVYVNNGGSLTLGGGEISGNGAANMGGGVYLDDSTLTMNTGTISGNSSNYGGGVNADNGSVFAMNGGTISGNFSQIGAGVLVYRSGSTFDMYTGAVISGNEATGTSGMGGGVYTTTTTTFNLHGGEISGNEAIYGAGVYASAAFTMDGGKISGNVATAYGSRGGGVEVANDGTFTMNDGEISGNKASAGVNAFGGGVNIYYGDFNLNGGRITGNEAANGGGVSFNAANSSFTMAAGAITANHATGTGGGLYVNGGNSTNARVAGGQITGNTVDGPSAGAGVYWRSGNLTLAGTPQIGSATDTNAIQRMLTRQVLGIDPAGLSGAAHINIDPLDSDAVGTIIATKAGGANVTPTEAGYFHYFGGVLVERGADVILSATVPGPPQNFKAAAGNGRVTLSWTAPLTDGGMPITGYEVSLDGGASWVTPASATGHVFTGLANGTEYPFRVRALNALGAGAAAEVAAAPGTAAPAPGDGSTPGAWLALLGLALAGFCAGALAQRRRRPDPT